MCGLRHKVGRAGLANAGPPNGLELSCPAAQATVDSFSHNFAGKSRSNFPHASRVSCSELLGGHGMNTRARLVELYSPCALGCRSSMKAISTHQMSWSSEKNKYRPSGET